MKTIYKYPLKVDEGIQEIGLPEGARILTVALQGNVPTIWAEVDREGILNLRRFCIYATGQPIADDAPRAYVGTFQIVGLIGTLVGHVFELV